MRWEEGADRRALGIGRTLQGAQGSQSGEAVFLGIPCFLVIDFTVERTRFDERPKLDNPTLPSLRRQVLVWQGGPGKLIVAAAVVVLDGQAELFEVVGALRPSGRFADFPNEDGEHSAAEQQDQ